MLGWFVLRTCRIWYRHILIWWSDSVLRLHIKRLSYCYMYVQLVACATVKAFRFTVFCPWWRICTPCATFWWYILSESSWNMMAHGDAREGKWRGNWWMEWVASTLHMTSERGVSSITTADAHILAASSRLNWRPHGWFKLTCPFCRKTKSGFCACAITFQMQSTHTSAKRIDTIGISVWHVCVLSALTGQFVHYIIYSVMCFLFNSSHPVTWTANCVKTWRDWRKFARIVVCDITGGKLLYVPDM